MAGTVQCKEPLPHAVWNNSNRFTGDPVKVLQIPTGCFGGRDEVPRAMRGHPQKQAPERQIKTPKVLRMTLVLQIMKHRNQQARRQEQ